MDGRPGEQTQIPIERWAGKAIFYFFMLFVLIAFFTTVKLHVITLTVECLAAAVAGLSAARLGGGILLLWRGSWPPS